MTKCLFMWQFSGCVSSILQFSFRVVNFIWHMMRVLYKMLQSYFFTIMHGQNALKFHHGPIVTGDLWPSEWLLFNAKRSIFRYIMARTTWVSTRIWWYPLCTIPTLLDGFLIVIVRWSNSPFVDMLLHSDNTSNPNLSQLVCLHYSLFGACLVEK